MNIQIPVVEKITWIGENDRHKPLFENLWTLPYGVSYNAYIIDDERTALVDTIDRSAADGFLERIAEQLQGRALDYLIINHIEPDHSGMIGDLARQYPDMKIVGNTKTFKILESYFGLTENLVEVKDGDTLELGRHRLHFLMTPWVHWPETMMTYDLTTHTLFSGDAFGSFGAFNGGIFDDEVRSEFYESEALRYFSNIVGQYSNMVQKAIAKLKNLPVSCVCSTHGLIWRKNPQRIIDLYDKWSSHSADEGVLIAFASMYGNCEKIADYTARRIAEQGIRDIQVCDVSKTHFSFLLSAAWKYRGVVLGSCTYNNRLHPNMEIFCSKLAHIQPKNKTAAAFGSYSWNGGATKHICETFAALQWTLAAEPVEIMGMPSLNQLKACDVLAENIARAIKN